MRSSMLTLIYSNNEEAKIPIEHVNIIELTDRKKVIFVINNELNEYAVYNKIIIKIDKSINDESLLLDSPNCETNIGQLLLRKDLVAIEYTSNKKHKYYTNWNDDNDHINLNQANTNHDTYIEIKINKKD